MIQPFPPAPCVHSASDFFGSMRQDIFFVASHKVHSSGLCYMVFDHLHRERKNLHHLNPMGFVCPNHQQPECADDSHP